MCVSRGWRVLVVGGWGRIHGNTPPPPPLGPKRQSLTHTHIHTCTRSTTGPAEPDQYFSPFKEQNSENGFSAPRLQPCFRPWVFTLNTQSAKWRGFFVLTQNNSWPESFLFFHFTVLMDPFSPGRTSVLLSIFVWFSPRLSLSVFLLFTFTLSPLSLPASPSEWQGQIAFSILTLCLTLWLTTAQVPAGLPLVPWGVQVHLWGWRAGLALAFWPCWVTGGGGNLSGCGWCGCGGVLDFCQWVKWRRAPSSTSKLE